MLKNKSSELFSSMISDKDNTDTTWSWKILIIGKRPY